LTRVDKWAQPAVRFVVVCLLNQSLLGLYSYGNMLRPVYYQTQGLCLFVISTLWAYSQVEKL